MIARMSGTALCLLLASLLSLARGLESAAQPPPAAPHAAGAVDRSILARDHQHLTNAVEHQLDDARLSRGLVRAIIDGRAFVTTPANLSRQVERNAFFIEAVRTAPERAPLPAALAQSLPAGAARAATLLSNEFVVIAADGAASVRARAYARDGTGLVFSGARNRFEGDLAVAFADVAGDAARPLARPVPIMVFATGALEVRPSPVEVSELGRWYPVRVAVARAAGRYPVRVSASPHEPGDEVSMAVQMPTVRLIPASNRIIGWGLGKVSITVTASNLSDPAATSIMLDTDRGQFESGPAILNDQGAGVVTLRSVGEGVARVSLGEPYDAKPVEIEFVPPWAFLGLAGLGGVVGAVLRKRDRERWPKALLIGFVTAMVMTVAYAVGVDWVVRQTGWTALATAGEALVFVLGFLGSLLGVSVLAASAR